MSWTIFLLLGLASASPEVATSNGRVRGRIFQSRNGRRCRAFTGVPFAEPPVGSLRFLPPKPAKNWTGTLDATAEYNPVCYQWNSQTHTVIGKEDCLYLNVYTPEVSNASLPVMIYIHGGAFVMGAAPSAESSKYFMDEDVVLVTTNYRLGRLGFLSFEDETIPGNMGLKDQALALNWVNREIRAFGGNPDLITLFGISAGSASVHYLCSSPRTAGLIKGCISQSGVGGPWMWTLSPPGKARIAAQAIAEALGCTGNDLIPCLQSKTVEEIMNPALISWETTARPTPVIERPSTHAIITSWPPKVTDFPWITGVTADEGILFTGYYEFIKEKLPLEKYASILKKNIMDLLHSKNQTNEFQHVLDRFLKNNSHPLTAGRKFGTEAYFLYPALEALKQHSGPKYFYVFNYTGGPSYYEVLLKKKLNISGVCHHDDYPFFFYKSYNYTIQKEDWPKAKDVELSQALIKTWVAFARDQSPAAEIPEWKKVEDQNYLIIDNKGFKTNKYEGFNDVYDFWKNVL